MTSEEAAKRYFARLASKSLPIGPCSESADGKCAGPIQKHHTDYDRPLEVVCLCRFHHHLAHRNLRGLGEAARPGAAAVQKAVSIAGSQAKLAKRLKVGQTTVASWIKRGLPADWAPEVEAATGVPRAELRPALWNIEKRA